MPEQPPVVWSGKQFSMRPVHPGSALNPVVRVLNMVMGADGSLERRHNFDPAPGGSPLSHIVAELNGQAFIIIKETAGLKYSNGGAFQTLAMATQDPPINAGLVAGAERGSFALHGNEIYYCDSNTIVAWDGLNPARRPGVIGLQGLTYNGTAANGNLLPGGPFGKTPAANPATDADYVKIPGINPLWPGCDPGIIGPQNISPTSSGVLVKGEKALNTAFAFSYYDAKRKIYGRRSEMFAYPYVFGPPDADGSNQILTDQRTQYAKAFKTPISIIHPEYKIAVWFSIGQEILTNLKSTVLNFPFFYFNEAAPSMSKRMTQTCFLEAIVNPGMAEYDATKDNATLVQSGRYIDAYERPVPAKFMAILNTGTAIYFFPWTTTPEQGGLATSIANHALYSVNHPEQIGLNTETQRDTTSPLPNLRGIPKASISDGSNQFLLTNQGVYAIGFDGGVALHEISGRGLRAQSSLAFSSVGVLWFSDEGVNWLRSGQMILLDEKLGFSDWFSKLNPSQKQQVVIGAADSARQILVFAADLDNGGTHAMVYDYERDFVSEFNGVSLPTYAAFFRSDSAGQLWLFGTGKYPGDSYDSDEASVTMWLNVELDVIKTLQEIVIDVGPRGGSITIAVEAHQAGETAEGDPAQTDNRSKAMPATGNGSGRFTFIDFIGMRGRMFKIKITGPAGKWTLQKVMAYYMTDEETDAQSE